MGDIFEEKINIILYTKKNYKKTVNCSGGYFWDVRKESSIME